MTNKKSIAASTVSDPNLAAPDINNIFRFLHKAYDESLELMVNTRDYLADYCQADKSNFSAEQKLAYNFALSIITTQLTSVMSWLMFCKAVEKGELAKEQITIADLTMPEFNSQMQEDPSVFASLNLRVLEIMQRSSSLYNRIKRLEEPMKKQFIGTAPRSLPESQSDDRVNH